MGTLCTLVAAVDTPRHVAPFVPIAAPRPAPRAQRRTGGSGRARLLIVDDEADIVASLMGLLESELDGVEVVGVASGQQALEVLSRESVDLVVTDFRMPGMDGLELLQKVRGRWPEVPTVLVSAYADEGLARKAQTEGHVDLLMPKPLPLDAFVDEVQRILA